MSTFKIDPNANPAGCSFHDTTIDCSFSQLVALFGPPLESDGYKISGEWLFTDKSGNVATVYDWKETSLYDSDYPTVEELRSQPVVEWHIGARDQANARRLKAQILQMLQNGAK